MKKRKRIIKTKTKKKVGKNPFSSLGKDEGMRKQAIRFFSGTSPQSYRNTGKTLLAKAMGKITRK